MLLKRIGGEAASVATKTEAPLTHGALETSSHFCSVSCAYVSVVAFFPACIERYAGILKVLEFLASLQGVMGPV